MRRRTQNFGLPFVIAAPLPALFLFAGAAMLWLGDVALNSLVQHAAESRNSIADVAQPAGGDVVRASNDGELVVRIPAAIGWLDGKDYVLHTPSGERVYTVEYIVIREK